MPKATSSVYRLKNAILQSVTDENADSYSKIQHLLMSFEQLNAGCVVSLQKHGDNQFMCAFVSSPVACSSIEKSMTILGADGTMFRNAQYNGVLLTLHGVDGNKKTFLVCFAIVPKENECNWYWFFRLAFKAGVQFHNKVLFVDRDKGSIAAALRLASDGIVMHLRWCIQHIIRNCVDKFGISCNNTKFRTLVFDVQKACNVEEHRSAMKKIAEDFGATVAEYLRCINPNSWITYANMQTYEADIGAWHAYLNSQEPETASEENTVVNAVPHVNAATALQNEHDMDSSSKAIMNMFIGSAQRMYDCSSTNFVESQNGVLAREGIRSLYPYGCIKALMSKMVDQAYKRSEQALKWKREGHVITPYAKNVFDDEKAHVGRCKASPIVITGEETFEIEIWDKYRPNTHFLVVKSSHGKVSCTCRVYDQLGIVCRHILFAADVSGKALDVHEMFANCYQVKHFVQAFLGKSVHPVLPQNVMAIPGVLPSLLYSQLGCPKKTKAGRPPFRWIRSYSEHPSSSTRNPTCALCGDCSHNIWTCPGAATCSVADNVMIPGDYVCGTTLPPYIECNECMFTHCTSVVASSHYVKHIYFSYKQNSTMLCIHLILYNGEPHSFVVVV